MKKSLKDASLASLGLVSLILAPKPKLIKRRKKMILLLLTHLVPKMVAGAEVRKEVFLEDVEEERITLTTIEEGGSLSLVEAKIMIRRGENQTSNVCFVLKIMPLLSAQI